MRAGLRMADAWEGASAAGRKPAGLSALLDPPPELIRSLPLRDGLFSTQDPVTSAVRPGEARCDTRKSPPQLHPEGGSD